MEFIQLSTFLVFMLVSVACSSNLLEYEQHIVTSGDYNYGLYRDAYGIREQGYYVLKLEKNITPEDVFLKFSMKGLDKAEREWLDQRLIMFNYVKGRRYIEGPKIEFIDNRFLVFKRGGYYYGLFDSELKTIKYYIASPWDNFILEKKGSSFLSSEKEEIEYTKWIKENIHDKINTYILANR